MSATFEEALLDFDINFLQPPVNANESRGEKYRRQILTLKKKIISIDTLLKKFYSQREKWEQNEVVLLTAKEECKQACINYQDTLEKCAHLEKELDLLSKQNAELDSKCILSQSQYEGMKSHANQLELLVKEQESVIEALKIEKHLEKNNSHDHEDNLSSIQKENKALLKHLSLIKDIALGKKKLRERHKVLLQKYDFEDISEDDSSSDDSCDQPDFFDDSPHSPLFTNILPEDCTRKKKEQVLNPNIQINIKKDLAQFNEDSDCSNELVSEDTGRGSSLTFSDGEKCFNSPDYFSNDSPEHIATKVSKNNINIVLMDTGTSPNRSHEVVHAATSPLIFDDEALLSDSNMLFQYNTDVNSKEYFIGDIPLSNDIVTIKEKRKLIDTGTSPIKDIIKTSPIKEIEKITTATSPLSFDKYTDIGDNNASMSTVTDYQTSGPRDNSSRKPSCIVIDETATSVNGKYTVINDLASNCEFEMRGNEERKCLEINNSKSFCDENSCDAEIDMILNTMRFTQRLITPIPKTPVKVRKHESGKVQELFQNLPELSGDQRVCLDSLALREDFNSLHKDMGGMMKDISYIKCFIKDCLMQQFNTANQNNEKSKIQVSNKNDYIEKSETYDDTRQETIIIHPNDDESNSNNEDSAVNNFNLSNSSELCSIIEANKNNCTGNVCQNGDILIQAPSLNASRSPSVTTISEPPANGSFERSTIPNIEHDYAKNDSREVITYEEDLRNEDESDIINIDADTNVEDLSEDCCKMKRKKNKKLSKLDKFKKKLQPKSKISKMAQIHKLRSKSRPLPIVQLPRMHTITISNNKSALENTLKVIAELKSKEIDLASKKIIARKANNIVDDKNNSKDRDYLDHQLTPDTEDIDIRRNLSDDHDFNDKHLKTIGDDNQQIEPLFKTTENRSRKLSNSSNSSWDEIYIREKDTSKSEENRSKNKRVLRSSRNRNLFTDLDYVNPKLTSKAEKLFDEHDIKRSRKLSNCEDEERNYSDIFDNVPSAHNKKRKRKLSNCMDEEQSYSDIVGNVSSVPNKKSKLSNSKDEKPSISDKFNNVSKIENEKQNINYNIKNVSVVLNKVQAPKLLTIGDENENISNYNGTHNKIQDRISNVDKKEQEHIKCTEVSDGDPLISHPKQSILCEMLEKHGRQHGPKSKNLKVPDNITNSISKKLEEGIASIIDLSPAKAKPAMNKLVDEVQSWDLTHFLLGLMVYLNDPARKIELYKKFHSPPAPPMTKSEQVVLYIVRGMRTKIPNIVELILTFIEFSLFPLNRTPDFDIIESLSHIYALICRYFGLKTRLRHFMLDAMYCLQFKVVPLIKQCLDAWMHILPLAHMGSAKSPLVTCLVYLLHFYKCEDKFNRVKEIRCILSQKYFYKFSDWNEPRILEMFKTYIKEVRDIPIQKKMLRISLLLLGKRHGAKWCLKNIINNMLMPIIESEDTPMKRKMFCVQMLGALLKPFPADMKLHLEIIVSQLHDILQQNPPDAFKEAIFSSLMYISHHNENRLQRALIAWQPKQISPEFQLRFRDYVRGRPLHVWAKILTRMTM
ncbi:jg18519 [Pararge aegeria aegeria]|uniref:Jg18519 protein n=7 Tax=Pararge aegeria TaxID=116150 RepID=A0A8S4S2V3_9NEOP|nr:jg18519 [Pararge aegeria aegeria]